MLRQNSVRLTTAGCRPVNCTSIEASVYGLQQVGQSSRCSAGRHHGANGECEGSQRPRSVGPASRAPTRARLSDASGSHARCATRRREDQQPCGSAAASRAEVLVPREGARSTSISSAVRSNAALLKHTALQRSIHAVGMRSATCQIVQGAKLSCMLLRRGPVSGDPWRAGAAGAACCWLLAASRRQAARRPAAPARRTCSARCTSRCSPLHAAGCTCLRAGGAATFCGAGLLRRAPGRVLGKRCSPLAGARKILSSCGKAWRACRWQRAAGAGSVLLGSARHTHDLGRLGLAAWLELVMQEPLE
jgi:hypothetical protein